MSMQNFPRIPKITLRTPADQAKDTKNELLTADQKIYFFVRKCQNPGHIPNEFSGCTLVY